MNNNFSDISQDPLSDAKDFILKGHECMVAGKFSEATGYYIIALKIHESCLGETHPYLAIPSTHLGLAYKAQGQFLAAEYYLNQAVDVLLNAEDPDISGAAGCMYNLAVFYEERAEYKKAKLLFEKSYLMHKETRGEDHPNTKYVREELGRFYQLYRTIEEDIKHSTPEATQKSMSVGQKIGWTIFLLVMLLGLIKLFFR